MPQSCFKINFFMVYIFIYHQYLACLPILYTYIRGSQKFLRNKSFSGVKRSYGVLNKEGFRNPALDVSITDTGRCGWMLLHLPCYVVIWSWFTPQHQESRLWRTNCTLTVDSALALIPFLFLSSPDNFQDQMKRELAYREEMVQQLQIVRAISAYRHM